MFTTEWKKNPSHFDYKLNLIVNSSHHDKWVNESDSNGNTPIPCIVHILGFEKTALHENHVSGTVLMIQLTRNSPTCAYIDQNPRKWIPC